MRKKCYRKLIHYYAVELTINCIDVLYPAQSCFHVRKCGQMDSHYGSVLC